MTTTMLNRRLDRIDLRPEIRLVVLEVGETREEALARTGLSSETTIFVCTGVRRATEWNVALKAK